MFEISVRLSAAKEFNGAMFSVELHTTDRLHSSPLANATELPSHLANKNAMASIVAECGSLHRSAR